MAARLRSAGRRLADLGTGFVDTFLRDNRVLPPVLAVLALFVVAWILAGALVGEPDQEPVAHKADLAQANNDPGPDPRRPRRREPRRRFLRSLPQQGPLQGGTRPRRDDPVDPASSRPDHKGRHDPQKRDTR